jgi:hypothetical protein
MHTIKMLSIVSIIVYITMWCFLIAGKFYNAAPMWLLLWYYNLLVLPALSSFTVSVSGASTVLSIYPLNNVYILMMILTIILQLVAPCLTLLSVIMSKPLLMLLDIILTLLGLVNTFIVFVISVFTAFKYLDFYTSRVSVVVMDMKVLPYLLILIGVIVFMVCVFIGKLRCFITLRDKKNNKNIYCMLAICAVISSMISVFCFQFILHS